VTDELLQISSVGDDGVVVLTLHRPEKKNALSIALRDAISDALDVLAADDRVRALVVTGAGDAFCAGFDLEEFSRPELAEELWASSDRWHRTVIECPVPIVAAVNGAAYGGGFDLAVMCTLRVIADTARLAHPERTFAQVVYGPLHELVGGAVARDLALTGRRIDAQEADRLGLATRVAPRAEVVDVAIALAREVAETPRDVLLTMMAKIRRRAGIVAGPTLDL
jgi:enoyl-CoA hydratase/carnithine racemase